MRKPTRAPKKRSTQLDSKITKAAEQSKRSKGMNRVLSKAAEQVLNLFAGEPRDIVAAIKMDHDSLRDYIKVLKNTDKPMTERRRAYKAFASLLKSHSVSEEQIVYKVAAKLAGHELHIKVSEGFVEHQMCDELMRRLERTKDSLSWSAHVNVLAEILEHHLDEEERDLLPLVRKKLWGGGDEQLLKLYVRKRAQTQKTKSPKNSGVLTTRSAT